MSVWRANSVGRLARGLGRLVRRVRARWRRRAWGALDQQFAVRRHLDQLEDRLTPVTWDGGGGNLRWTDPLNWVGDMLPTAADDVVIPDLSATTDEPIFIPAGSALDVKSVASQQLVELDSNAVLRLHAPSTFGGGVRVYGGLVSTAPVTLAGHDNQYSSQVSYGGTLDVGSNPLTAAGSDQLLHELPRRGRRGGDQFRATCRCN